jgi:hypothetical protein
MHVPWCLYDGTQFARFYGTPASHQPIFRMIHDNRQSFDGYVPVLWHVMEVPYGDRGIEDMKKLEADLRNAFDAGIPVTVRLRARDSIFGPDRFQGKPASRHVWGQTAMPERGAGPLRLLSGFDGAYLPPIPRVSAEASTFPLVLHFVRGFDEKSAQSARFEISKDWLPASRIKNLSMASVEWPGQPAASIRWEGTPEGNTLVEIEKVPAWAVVRVETKEPVQLPGIARSGIRERMPESEIPLMRMIRFGDKWKRPAWVDEALKSDSDPLDEYHITRITWSYEPGEAEREYARKRGWGFHGSIGLLHSHNGPPSPLGSGSDMITRPSDWKGWVRYPDGQAMLIRPDWNPPRYGMSFASPEYRHAVIERAREWMALGVTGIQLDDVMGMLNRVWQYGGDYSDAMMKILRSRLAAAGFAGVTEKTPLEELRKNVVSAMQWENAARIVNAAPPGRNPSGWMSTPYQAGSYPGEVWVGPQAFANPGAPFVVEFTVRFSGGKGPWARFLLADGDRSVYLSRFDVTPETHAKDLPSDEWHRIRLKYDPVHRTMSHAMGAEAPWADPVDFDIHSTGEKSFSVILMANPLVGGIDVRSVMVKSDSSGPSTEAEVLFRKTKSHRAP